MHFIPSIVLSSGTENSEILFFRALATTSILFFPFFSSLVGFSCFALLVFPRALSYSLSNVYSHLSFTDNSFLKLIQYI
jgi:hypothetical protein